MVVPRPAPETSSSFPGRLGIAGRWWLVAPRLLMTSGLSVAVLLLLQFGLDQERTYTLLTTAWFALALPALIVVALRWWPHGWAHAGWPIGCGVLAALFRADHGMFSSCVGAVLVAGFAAWQFRLAGWRWLAGGGADVALSPARMRWRGSYGGHLSATRDELRYTLDRNDRRSPEPPNGRESALAWTEILTIQSGFWSNAVGEPNGDELPAPAVRVVGEDGTQLVMCVPAPMAVAQACRLRREAVLVGALRSSPRRVPDWLMQFGALVPIIVIGVWDQSLTDRQRAWALVGVTALVLLAPVVSGWQLRTVRRRFAEAAQVAEPVDTDAPAPTEWEPADFVPPAAGARVPDSRDRVALASAVPLALALIVALVIVSSDADSATQLLFWGVALLLMAGVLCGVGPRFPVRTPAGRVAVGLLGLICCAGVSLTAIGVGDIVRADAAATISSASSAAPGS